MMSFYKIRDIRQNHWTMPDLILGVLLLSMELTPDDNKYEGVKKFPAPPCFRGHCF